MSSHGTYRVGLARFEVAVTICFLALAFLMVSHGGPAHLLSTILVCLVYATFGFLIFVHKEFLIASIAPIPLTLFTGDPHAFDRDNIHVAQIVLWIGSAIFWVPALMVGQALRRRLEKRRERT
ncbi:MAG: hypothetical protein J0H66_11635 [Solirubrobacterales bacterium]|nr:hypothetical protein [Solirubrobacterales bacterium]OJU94780.1 MAG: hypothetical protein BGO23_07960 [Solirubrobacterales bacterium 67-14]